jgi:catalase
MQSVPRDIQLRQIAHFLKADAAYGGGVAKDLGIDEKEVAKLAA